MTYVEPAFTVGVEEEYLLVDVKTREVATDPPNSMFNNFCGLNIRYY
jgi:hypothetical protein